MILLFFTYIKAHVGVSEADRKFLLANPKPIFDWAWDSFIKLSNFVNNLFCITQHWSRLLSFAISCLWLNPVNSKKNLFHESELSTTERAQLLWDLGEVSVKMQDLHSVFEALVVRESGWSEADEDTLDTLRAHQARIHTTFQVLIILVGYKQGLLMCSFVF